MMVLKLSSFTGNKQASLIKSGRQSVCIHSNADHSESPVAYDFRQDAEKFSGVELVGSADAKGQVCIAF